MHFLSENMSHHFQLQRDTPHGAMVKPISMPYITSQLIFYAYKNYRTQLVSWQSSMGRNGQCVIVGVLLQPYLAIGRHAVNSPVPMSQP